MQKQTQTTAKSMNDAKPVTMQKRIGSTNYVVSVYSSNTSRETVEDKILRLIKRRLSDIA